MTGAQGALENFQRFSDVEAVIDFAHRAQGDVGKALIIREKGMRQVVGVNHIH
jgi:hypothetical protein